MIKNLQKFFLTIILFSVIFAGSAAKSHSAELLSRGRSVPMAISDDTLVERFFREIRPFRIYDGPSEVHRWAIAKRLMKSAAGKNIPM